MNYKSAIAGICFLVMAAAWVPALGQVAPPDKFSFEFRGEALSEVLEEVAKKTEIDLVYDPVLVEGYSIYARINKQAMPDLLGDILEDTPLDYLILSSGTIVIVEKVNEPPAYGSYFGKVVGGETGEPLPGATVMLADASGGTSTNRSGSFSLNKLKSGTYKIIFSYVGYEAVSKTIDIGPGEELHDEVSLEPKPVDFAPIVVTDHVPQMPHQGGSGQLIDPNSEWETTGRMQDVIRSLSLFQGVQYGLPMTDLHLQGGQPGEHRIRLDGVPVYNPHSFGQMFSAFSPYSISTVRVHKAGYGVSEGSQIAGLIDMNHDISGISANRFTAQGDPLSVNLRGDLNFTEGIPGDDSSLKVMGAGRFNYWDLFQEPVLDRTLREWDDLDPLITNLLIDSDSDASLYEPREHFSDVKFHDLHLASRYKINAYHTLSSSFYLGKNAVSTDLLQQGPQNGQSPEYLYARDAYSWNNFMGQISYNQLVSPRLDINTQVSFSSNLFRHRYLLGTNDNPQIPGLGANAGSALAAFQEAGEQNLVPEQRNNNRIRHAILRTEGTYSFTPRFNLSGGLQLDYVESRVDLTDLFYLPTLTDQQSTLLSGHLNGNWTLGEYWKITAGNRLTYSSSAKRIFSEPRAALQLDRPDSGIGYWSARVSGGLYRQFINQFEITNPGPTSLVPAFTVWSHAGTSEVPKAWHLSGSFHLEPAKNTTINIEWFYKWQPATYTVSYDNLLQGTNVNRTGLSAFAESTEMSTRGAGLRLNQSLAESRLKLMLGYDYSHARINLDTQFGRELPAPWNEPHRLQFRALWRVVPELSAVVKWKSVYGRKWGFRQSYYNYLFFESEERFGDFSFSTPENDRLNAFHQLDLSFIYKPSLEFTDVEFRVDLINLLDRRNTIDWSLRPEQPGEGSEYRIKKRTMPGFSPSISLQVDF